MYYGKSRVPLACAPQGAAGDLRDYIKERKIYSLNVFKRSKVANIFYFCVLQTGAMDLPVEDKDSGCSMDTSNADDFEHPSNHPSNRPYACSSPNRHSNVHSNHRDPHSNHRDLRHSTHKDNNRRSSRDRTNSSPMIHTNNLEPGYHGNDRDSYHDNSSKPALPPRENRKSNRNISQMFARDVLYRDIKNEAPVSVCKVHGIPSKITNSCQDLDNPVNNSVNMHEISSEVHV